MSNFPDSSRQVYDNFGPIAAGACLKCIREHLVSAMYCSRFVGLRTSCAWR